MIKALSYMFAVILTLAIAIILYPIAGVFWILGLFGKISDALFNFTKKALSSIWREMREMGNSNNSTNSKSDPNYSHIHNNYQNNPTQNTAKNTNISENTWTCSCGSVNTGYFCRECGKKKS